MIKFFKSLNLRWYDIFLVIGFLSSIPVYVEGMLLMGISSPVTTTIPFWLLTTLCINDCVCFLLYLIFGRKSGQNTNIIIVAIFFLIVAVSAISMLELNPITFNSPNYMTPSLDDISVSFTVSKVARMTLMYNLICTVIPIYTGIFVLPQRMKNKNIILVFGLVTYTVIAISIIYSVIKEFFNYGKLFTLFFDPKNDGTGVKNFVPKSFFNNSNIFGMVLEFGCVVSFITMSISKKKYHIAYFVTFLIMLHLTFCRSAIVILDSLLFIYLIYRAILTIKANKKKGLIFLFTYLGSLSTLVVTFIILYACNNYLARKIVFIFNQGTLTLSSRLAIWKYGFESLKEGRFFFGRGYGLFNLILFNATEMGTSSSHSFIINLLGRGGIVYLGSYIALLVYIFITFFKTYKKDRILVSSILLALLTFIFHSCFEDNYYPVIVFSIFLLLVKEYHKEQLAFKA